jgi:hypothetical protein
MPSLSLTSHPTTPCTYVRAVSVHVDRVGEHVLALHYRVEGDLDELRCPAPRTSQQTDGLWQHACFEAFVKHGDTRAYLEFNFSPSSEWAIYAFDDFRAGMQPRQPRHPPEIVTAQRGDGVLEVDVTVDLDGLLAERTRADARRASPEETNRLRLSVAAVLEDRRGALSYWALAHPSERPDFHHPDSFVFWLPALKVSA